MRIKSTGLDVTEMEMNLVAMIDCLLLILIFFIVTAVMRKAHMEVPMTLVDQHSALAGKPPPERKVVTIRVFEGPDRLPMYGVASGSDELSGLAGPELAGAVRQLGAQDQHLHFLLSSRLGYGALVRSMDLLRTAGAKWASCSIEIADTAPAGKKK